MRFLQRVEKELSLLIQLYLYNGTRGGVPRQVRHMFDLILPADYITGKLSPGIYAKDCKFIDPTTNVQGVETYSKAVASLFDKDDSRADLISIEVRVSMTLCC